VTAFALLESNDASAIEAAATAALKVERWRSEATQLMTLQGQCADLQRAVREVDSAEKPTPYSTGRGLYWQIGHLVSEAGAISGSVDKWLFTVVSTVPAEDQDEFEEWFDSEHIPRLLAIPGWRSSRRYRITASSDGSTHLTLHLIDGPHLLNVPARAAAANTDWASSFASRSWFGLNRRAVYAPCFGTQSP
jgi:hypothetical protein